MNYTNIGLHGEKLTIYGNNMDSQHFLNACLVLGMMLCVLYGIISLNA